MVTVCTALADGVPVITIQPQSQTISPGLSTTLSVVSANATAFQWRFNGADISGATSSTLQIASPQTTDSGYYMVVARNATSWVPSQLAYLAIVASAGTVPFSNQANASAQARYQGWDFSPINNGTARVFAGPALDQMKPVVATAPVNNGYFNHSSVPVPSVSPGQTVYYRVEITYTVGSSTYTQTSRVLTLVAGGGSYPVPSASDLLFPVYIEWPDPPPYGRYAPTNQVRVPGETVTLTSYYWCYYDFGFPNFQWRKDGNIIPGSTNYIILYSYPHEDGNYQPFFTITNAQAADAGDYDVVVNGSYCFVDVKTTLSIQLTNGPGLFMAPRTSGSQFVCDLLGVAGRNYAIQWSSNLYAWNDLQTLSNTTGTVTFTNAPATAAARYYRSRLLP
jgi:hypothetical protein